MRTAACLFTLIMLLPLKTLGYEAEANRFVHVAEPLVRVVSNDRQLVEWCGVEGVIEACTRFISYRLESACSPVGEQWSMRATATFRPWIFLRNLAQLRHERDHVADLQRYAAAHAASLEALSFGTADECRQRSVQEVARFGETMRGFARRSNEERHGRRR